MFGKLLTSLCLCPLYKRGKRLQPHTTETPKCSNEMNLEGVGGSTVTLLGCPRFLRAFCYLPWYLGIVSWLPVCLSPEMNEEAFEATSVTCNCLWAQQHRTNSSPALGPCLLRECGTLLSTFMGYYSDDLMHPAEEKFATCEPHTSHTELAM